MADVTIYKRCNREVANLRGVQDATGDIAHDKATEAIRILAAHRAEGHSRIEVTKGDIDYYVTLNDERGDWAAAAIEYGRKREGGGRTRPVHALHKAFGLGGDD